MKHGRFPVVERDPRTRKGRWVYRLRLDNGIRQALTAGWVWYDQAWHCPDCRRPLG